MPGDFGQYADDKKTICELAWFTHRRIECDIEEAS